MDLYRRYSNEIHDVGKQIDEFGQDVGDEYRQATKNALGISKQIRHYSENVQDVITDTANQVGNHIDEFEQFLQNVPKLKLPYIYPLRHDNVKHTR